MLMITLMSLSFILFSIIGCVNVNSSSEIIIFAAAGAKPAIDEVCKSFEQQFASSVEVNYGGGGEILSNMVLSRSGDVYVAPEQGFMTTAVEKGAVYQETVQSLAYMVPVIVIRKDNPRNIFELADLAKPGVRIAITRPETTLLGEYAPEIFQKAGLSEAIGQNIVTHAASPSSLLNMLLIGHVDAGILWHFYQALALEKIETIYLSPEQITGIGEMQMAMSVYSTNKELSEHFIDFAVSSEGKVYFQKYGYIVDIEEVKKYWH